MTIDSFRGPYQFLSNFYRHEISYDGVIYPTNEHAFQAAKTLDDGWRRAIIAATTPGEAKRLGREVPLRPDWDERKVILMTTLNSIKFTSGTVLAKQLTATDGHELIEGNRWHDQFWGDCYCGRTRCGVPGRNMLGKILMLIRAAQLGKFTW